LKDPRWLVAVILLLVAGSGGGWWMLKQADDDLAHGVRRLAVGLGMGGARMPTGANVQPRHPGMLMLAGQNASSQAEASLDPKAQLELWSQRLVRAEEVLENYRKQTAYPFESRPAREHADQMYPNRPVVEYSRLKNPGQKPSDGVRIRTSQERVYVAGSETVLFTVNAMDMQGNPLPLTVTRAIAHDPPLDGKPSKTSSVTVPFNDDGANGDVVAGDTIVSARLNPATQGFANHAGTIRVELILKVNDESGVVFFDIFYTPDPPAVWSGGVREALEAGSLNLYLKTQVRDGGRYVIAGRVDDAKGQAFALITFNDELASGAREVKLNLFGKLLVDEKPSFPLTLRDVDGFLLKADTDPDRALMPRLPGRVLVTKTYALSAFSEAEWNSEERARYLAEYGNDVESARAHLEHVRRSLKP
jgi:hypothetical protein